MVLANWCSQCEHWSVKRCCWNTLRTPAGTSSAHKHVWHWSSGNLFSCFPIILSRVISGQMGRLLIFYCNSTRIWSHPRKIRIFFHPPFFLTSFCCVFSLCKYSLWWEERQKQNICLHRTRVTYLNHWSLLSYIVGKNIIFGEKKEYSCTKIALTRRKKVLKGVFHI